MASETVNWPESLEKGGVNPNFALLPPQYHECFFRALERLSLTINCGAPILSSCAGWLREDDDKLHQRFKNATLQPLLYRFSSLLPDPLVSDRERAIYYF